MSKRAIDFSSPRNSATMTVISTSDSLSKRMFGIVFVVVVVVVVTVVVVVMAVAVAVAVAEVLIVLVVLASVVFVLVVTVVTVVVAVVVAVVVTSSVEAEPVVEGMTSLVGRLIIVRWERCDEVHVSVRRADPCSLSLY
jgi:hypothetical protein